MLTRTKRWEQFRRGKTFSSNWNIIKIIRKHVVIKSWKRFRSRTMTHGGAVFQKADKNSILTHQNFFFSEFSNFVLKFLAKFCWFFLQIVLIINIDLLNFRNFVLLIFSNLDCWTLQLIKFQQNITEWIWCLLILLRTPKCMKIAFLF